MRYQWRVEQATLAPPQPSHEPDQLEDVLNRAEDEGWEIVTMFSEPKTSGYNRAHVVMRRDSRIIGDGE